MIKGNNKLKLSILATCTLLAVACGKSNHDSANVESKPFADLTPENETAYNIDLKRPDFSATPKVKEGAVDSTTDLANRIQHVRLDISDDEANNFNLSIKILEKDNQNHHLARFVGKTQLFKNKNTGFQDKSEGEQYEVVALCTEESCAQSTIVLTELATEKSVSLQYIRRNEFLKEDSVSKLKVSDEDRSLLNDAAEYHFPITRHAAKVKGRTKGSDVVDLLIIERPPVDMVDEDFSTGEQNETESPIEDEYKLELESSALIIHEPTDKDATPIKTTPSKQNSNSTESSLKRPLTKPSEKPADTKDAKVVAQIQTSQLVLTPDPYEVYNIKIPADKLNKLTVRDPLQLTNFFIVPVEQQEPQEPAYRMAILANAFVEQKVKIYKNACNIFVRGVMTLAGYTGGRVYNANDFDLMFKTKKQNLNEWQKAGFVYSGNSANIKQKTNTLQNILNNLPESYAVIAQTERPNRAHGHVAIVANMNGQTYLFDSSLNKRGPRKTVISAPALFSKSRKNLNMFGIKGIMKVPQSI